MSCINLSMCMFSSFLHWCRWLDPENHPANIVELNSPVVGTLGTPMVLRCLAYGWPAPRVQWWHGEIMLPIDSQQYEMRRDYSLLIRSLQISNLGEYICQAYNGYGAPGSWSVIVQAVRPVNVPEADEALYGKYLLASRPGPVVVTPRPYRPPPKIEEPVYQLPDYNGLCFCDF